jgi:hypothetical protein
VWAFFLIIVLGLGAVGSVNYLVDPNSAYHNQVRCVSDPLQAKIFQVQKIAPKSSILGNSKADYGFDPTDDFFLQPGFNFATPGSNLYENKLKLKWAIRQGELKQVLLVANYAMFNSRKQTSYSNFEGLFPPRTRLTYLFNYNTLIDSLNYAFSGENYQRCQAYEDNWKRDDAHAVDKIVANPRMGHLKAMEQLEYHFASFFSADDTYADTGRSAFQDFEEIIELCYQHNIKLDIVFGPSHIRYWETFDYYFGYEKLQKWKKDVVYSVAKLASKFNRERVSVFDFAVYHKLTSEKVPQSPGTRMNYYIESCHYQEALADIVLNRLKGGREHPDFGVKIDANNIEKHLQTQRQNRARFIDSEQFRQNMRRKAHEFAARK